MCVCYILLICNISSNMAPITNNYALFPDFKYQLLSIFLKPSKMSNRENMTSIQIESFNLNQCKYYIIRNQINKEDINPWKLFNNFLGTKDHVFFFGLQRYL